MARINRTQVVLQAQVRFGEVLDYYVNEFVHNPEKLSVSTRDVRREDDFAIGILPHGRDDVRAGDGLDFAMDQQPGGPGTSAFQPLEITVRHNRNR